MKKPIVETALLVEKMPGKGGWTYVVIPGIAPSHKNSLGQVRVRGTIDSFELKQFNLLPMKEGNMLLPLKTAVRKKIGKKEGDTVHVVLYPDDSAVVVPDDILACLLESPKAFQFFESLSDSNKKYYLDWIEAAKKLETKAERILKTMERLEKGRKFYDWPIKPDSLLL